MIVYRDRKFMVLLWRECVMVLSRIGGNACEVYELDAGRAVWRHAGILVPTTGA